MSFFSLFVTSGDRMIEIVERIVKDCGLRRSGRRYVGPCPECGGSRTSDRFQIRDDGGFKCFACDFKGDVITWLRKKDGMSCPEAHEAAGRECRLFSCPVRGTCRLGDGSGRRGGSRRRRVARPMRRHSATVPVSEATMPCAAWSAWAASLLESASREMQRHDDAMAWLEGRGIAPAAASRFRLGWLERDDKVARAKIGLPPRDDGKKHLWIPEGLVIPIFDDSGHLRRLRIRRTPASRDRFLPDLKYVWVEESGSGPMVIRPAAGRDPRGAVIVEAELDAMAVAASRGDVLVVALGTVRAGLPDELRRELDRLPVILVALDMDEASGGSSPAGQDAAMAWLSTFRRAKYWPVPEGKDPGEYAESGGDIGVWIEAGLPVRPSMTITSPGRQAERGNGAGAGEGGAGGGVVAREIVLDDGRSLWVTDDRDLWMEIAGEGKIVFSENELKRLGRACAELAPDKADVLKARVLDVKEVMGVAYIYRGGCEVG